MAGRKWRELYVRDGDRTKLLWDEESGQFSVEVARDDKVEQSPALTTYEAAADVFEHVNAAESLGQYVMRSHAEAIAVSEGAAA